MDWMNEQWDFTIDGKANGKIRMVIALVLTAVFTVLTIDQLQPQPNKISSLGLPLASLQLHCSAR